MLSQVPFSLFPSSYRNEAVSEEESSRVRVEGDTRRGAGREGYEQRYSSFSASLPTGHRKEEIDYYAGDRERRSRHAEDLSTYAEFDRHRDSHQVQDRVNLEFEEKRYDLSPQTFLVHVLHNSDFTDIT